MAIYRAYTVGLDGRYIGRTELDCADDSEAIEIAKQLNGGRDIELWFSDRFVVRIDNKLSGVAIELEAELAREHSTDEGHPPPFLREPS